jgi:segregation and condensation protein B
LIDTPETQPDSEPVADEQTPPVEADASEQPADAPQEKSLDAADEQTPPVEADASEQAAEDLADEAQAEAEQAEDPEEASDLADADEADDAEIVSFDPEDAAGVIEAILFASDAALPPARLASVAELPVRAIRHAVDLLNERYEKNQAAFRIQSLAGGYQMVTLPDYHDVLKRLLNVRKQSRLSQAAMETLAIVAYRQPILRADIEVVRGVACGEMLRSLLERGLAKIVGRADVIGRPMLYGTTKKFLEIFGLASIKDLPGTEELLQKEAFKPAPRLIEEPTEEPAEKSASKSDEKPAEKPVEDSAEQPVKKVDDTTPTTE